VPRSAVAVCLPVGEFQAVHDELADAGYEAIPVANADELEILLSIRHDIGLALLDGETDFDATVEMYALLHEGDRNVASLMVVSSTAADRLSLAGRARINGEFVTRPFSASSLRWRVEAMLIRAETMLIRAGAQGDEGRAGLIENEVGVSSNSPRGQIVVVFNPKGGVGKTTIAVNTAAVLQVRGGQRVLLIDCDTVTGHVVTSLGMVEIPTVVDVWGADEKTGDTHTLDQISSVHSSGIHVVTMSRSPLHTEVLEPKRVAQAIGAARESFDWVVVDMHPDYGPMNQGIFAMADQILVPVTPDVPTIRAAVQFREVAVELEIRDRLSLVVNRYNSGISAGDVEKVVGVAAIARVRSAGMLFVQAANTGKTAVEEYPRARVVGDIESLADRLIAMRDAAQRRAEGSPGRGFGRPMRDLLGRLAAQAPGRSSSQG
jgi:MinD-like ATPase involved in chromosome partitioning or flagellar assembly